LVLQGKPVKIFTRPYRQTTRKYERTSVNFESCIVSLQAQMSPYFQLKEKFNSKEHMDKNEIQLKTSP
ncbi:MAG: hypothetical protein AB2764_19795, partial [Candidatus Thiodiazotropha endolucinida]